MKFRLAIISFIIYLVTVNVLYANIPEKVFMDFDLTNERIAKDLILTQHGEGRPPVISEDILFLVNGGIGNNHRNTVLFPPLEINNYSQITCNFDLYITPGAEGCGVALLNREIYDKDSLDIKIKNWEEPSLPGSFAVGFDINNPVTSNWFNGDGNYYNRPEREISLHWDNREIIKKMSPIEFRQDPNKEDQFKAVSIKIQYVVGGAEVDLTIDNLPVFDRYFIPGMQPYKTRLMMGADTSEQTTSVFVKNVNLLYTNPVDHIEKPIKINCLNQEIMHGGNREAIFDVTFPKTRISIGRVILTLSLDNPPGGYDPWDKLGQIYLYDDNQIPFELVRFITPFHRGYTWFVDITDFLPLLKGTKTMKVFIDTWMEETEILENQKGWNVSIDIDMYPGKCEKEPIQIVNIWKGDFEYGNLLDPMENKFPEQRFIMPKGADGAKIRLMVTGHGMSPNTNNAAEFLPAERTLSVNYNQLKNLLWKDDCYLNSCRPQEGSWKFDRAGWAPGSIVSPWISDIANYIGEDGIIILDYIPMEYENIDKSDSYKPHHRVESQLIFYKNRSTLEEK